MMKPTVVTEADQRPLQRIRKVIGPGCQQNAIEGSWWVQLLEATYYIQSAGTRFSRVNVSRDWKFTTNLIIEILWCVPSLAIKNNNHPFRNSFTPNILIYNLTKWQKYNLFLPSTTKTGGTLAFLGHLHRRGLTSLYRYMENPLINTPVNSILMMRKCCCSLFFFFCLSYPCTPPHKNWVVNYFF